MQTVQEALGGVGKGRVGRPTGQRVHRDTRTARGQERAFWRSFDRKHTGTIIAAAEKFDRVSRLRNRREGRAARNGELGHIGLEVLRYLLSIIDHRTGRLDPSLATIARACGRSVAAVHDALKRLQAARFVTWIRRYVSTGQQGLRGPQVAQTSNAYALGLPAEIAAGHVIPLPDDDSHRRATAAAEAAAMIASLPLPEQAHALVEDDALARMLARLGAAIESKERGSGDPNESHLS